MTALLLSLLAAAAYGTSDFVGGTVSRRASSGRVAVVVQATAALATTAVALVLGGSPTAVDLAWSAAAGVGGGVGIAFLFRGLAEGRMGVVAPLSAVGSALVPVLVALVTGERPGLLVVVGIVAALPAIWLVASADEPGAAAAPGSSGAVDGLVAGAAFGAMFAGLGQVGDGAGLWPVAVAQGTSTVAAAALALALRQPWRPDRPALRAWPAGLASAVAVAAFQLAAQRGLLSVASVLTALYPAVTVLLAVMVLRERVHRVQGVGLALCAAAVALIALGA